MCTTLARGCDVDLDIQAMKFGVPLHRPVFQFLFSLWIITLFFLLNLVLRFVRGRVSPLMLRAGPRCVFFLSFCQVSMNMYHGIVIYLL